MLVLDAARITISAMALGLGPGCFRAIHQICPRARGFWPAHCRLPIHPDEAGRHGHRTEAARLLMYKAAVMKERGERITKIAAMAKVFATEAADRACWQAIQIHGGMGYSRNCRSNAFIAITG